MTATRGQWLELVDKVLKGGTFDRLVTTTADGIEVQPLYTGDGGGDDRGAAVAASDAVRGLGGGDDLPHPSGWDVRVVDDQPDVALANGAILDALENGATSVSIRFDLAFRSGDGAEADGVGVDGVAVWSADDLSRLLDGVYLELAPIELEAGVRFATAASWLGEVAAAKGVDPSAVSGSLGADPLGSLAVLGRLPMGLDATLAEAVELAAATAASSPSVRAVRIDAALHAAAGASPALELAALLATGAAYLRAFDAEGVGLDAAAVCFDATISVDADIFMSIAKLRAARRLWEALTAACGIADGHRDLRLVASSASAMMTRRDPWVNLLRVTAATFGAVVGGADSVIALPYDDRFGAVSPRGRRLARNTQLILGEESHVGHVHDPAGGSWYVEQLTEELARAAWSEFQQIEAAGGMAVVLRDGSWQRRLDGAFERREQRVDTRREPLTGVSEFPDLDEQPIVPAADADPASIRVRAAATGLVALSGDATTVEPLRPRYLAAQIEALRDAADAAAARDGTRPAVFLANLGPIAVHTARAGFARNLYAVGGLATVDNDGFDDDESLAKAFVASGATVACLCSSDAVYADRAIDAATALKGAGAARIELAGRPGALEGELTAAGVDAFIAVGTDVVAHLRALHDAMGVSR